MCCRIHSIRLYLWFEVREEFTVPLEQKIHYEPKVFVYCPKCYSDKDITKENESRYYVEDVKFNDIFDYYGFITKHNQFYKFTANYNINLWEMLDSENNRYEINNNKEYYGYLECYLNKSLGKFNDELYFINKERNRLERMSYLGYTVNKREDLIKVKKESRCTIQ